LATLVDRARCFRSAMAADPARKRELLEQLPQSVEILGNVAIDLRIGAFKIDVGDQGWCAMAGPGQKDDIQVIFLDQAVEVNVGQAHARIGAPMTEQTPLNMLGFEWLTKERIVSQVDHPGRQEQRSVPIRMHSLQLLGFKRVPSDRGTRWTIGADRLRFSQGRVHGSLRKWASGITTDLTAYRIGLRQRPKRAACHIMFTIKLVGDNERSV